MQFPRLKALALAAAVILQLLPAAHAEQAWPDRPVRLVVPYSPGGTTDYAARQIAQKLTEQTGKSFIVENKAGGSGTIGTLDIVRSAPDGGNFLIDDTTYAMLPTQFAKLPWNINEDLVQVTDIIQTPVVLIVPSSSPFKRLQDLVAYAKAHPGKLNFGSGGQGSSTHLAGELFKSVAGVDVAHIPYRGAGAALADVMSGQIDMLITAAPTALPPVAGGRVRALAISGSETLAGLPGVPTFAQAGVAPYDVVNWFGLAAPKGTPPAIVSQLHAQVQRALADPKLRQALAEQGARPGGMEPAKFGEFVKSELVFWDRVAKDARIQPQ